MTKTELRQVLLERRRQVALLDRQKAAANAAHLLAHTDLFQQSQHIACYSPLSNEFDSQPIIQQIWQAKKNCYLPVLSVADTRHLDFFLYEEETLLRLNRYRIPEPMSTESIPLEQLDLMLLPLVGFDPKGNRLGMGSGYYDRTLQTLKNKEKPILLGLAYEMQEVSSIPHDEWDVVLDGIVTEKRVIIV